jgi:hypothetical protein
MAYRIYTLAVGALLLVLSCGAPFEDYESYRTAPRQERLDALAHYLGKSDVENTQPFVLGIIDYTITDSVSAPVLAQLVPRDDFDQFMVKIVPAIYYSITQNLYASRPAEIAGLTDSIIVRVAMTGFLDLENCTPRLREEIRGQLLSGSYYFPVDESSFNLPIDSAYATAGWNSTLRTLSVDGLVANNLTVGDFLDTSLNTQVKLLRYELLYVGIVVNGVEDLDSYSMLVSALTDEWYASYGYYLYSTPVAAVGRGEQFSNLVDVLVDAAVNR